jgi:uncharacterized membrane protein YeaQ/YmgE (transglycosylase-associated protein family)
MVNVFVWLILGALVGWLGSTGPLWAQRWQANSGLGIAGALLGGLAFYRFNIYAATSSVAQISLNALLIAFIGAISLVTVVNVVQHGDGRGE